MSQRENGKQDILLVKSVPLTCVFAVNKDKNFNKKSQILFCVCVCGLWGWIWIYTLMVWP